MKKGIKIIAISIFSLVALIILGAVLAPVLFKDDIKQAADEAVSESLNAKIEYDLDAISLSVFTHFPDVTVGLGKVKVIGIEDFKNDTLFAMNSFEVAIDIMSLISGSEMQINGVYLHQPKITAIVLEDGKANWDIAKPSEEDTTVVEEETGESAGLNISEIIIEDAHVIYDDRQGNMFAEVFDLDHNSSINISSVYDITSLTTIKELTYKMDGVSFLKKNEFEAKIDGVFDVDNMKFTFKENSLRLNEFIFGFDGFAGIPEEEVYDVDLSFAAKETSFKNILSLVPAVYLTDFEKLKTSGSLAFDGKAKGQYKGEQIPAFDFNLQVKDGFFQYPDLPESLHDVNIDFTAANADGVLDNTNINLKQFHMDLGKNPIDMKAIVKGLDNPEIDANLKAQINLGDVSKMYPIEGTTLKGLFGADLSVKGVYDSTLQNLPVVLAKMSLKEGYVKSSEFPEAIETINFNSQISCPGNLTNTVVDVTSFSFKLNDEPFNTSLHLENLENEGENLAYKFGFDGVLDLTKLLKIYPLEDMDMGGRFVVESFNTSGNMKDLEAENYQALLTDGSLKVDGFSFKSEDLPQGTTIENAAMSFDPEKVVLSSYDGTLGKSDIHMQGDVFNYMGYLFSKTDTVLKGKLNFQSKHFDVNEWMTEEEEVSSEETAEEEAPLEVVPVPQNIDFVLNSKMDHILYDNMDINDLVGSIIVRDGRVSVQGATFNTLGGNFEMDGFYDAKDVSKPHFDYDMKMKNLDVQKAYETFAMIQELAPIAKNINGNIDLDFGLSGPLDQEMMPVLDLLSGKGMLNTKNATMKSTETSAFAKVGKAINQPINDVDISNTKIMFSIMDGKLLTEPFEVAAGEMKMLLSGNSTVTGAIDYISTLTIPGGEATKAANSLLSDYGASVGDDINVDLSILGDLVDPKVNVVGSKSSGGGAKGVANAAVDNAKADAEKRLKEEQKKAEEEAKRRAKAEQDKLEAEAKAKADAEKKRLEAEAKKKADAEKKRAADELKKKLPSW